MANDVLKSPKKSQKVPKRPKTSHNIPNHPKTPQNAPKHQSEEGKLPEYAISLVNKCLAVEIYAFQKSCWSYNPWGPVLRDIG